MKHTKDPAMEERAKDLAREIASYGGANVRRWLLDYPAMKRNLPQNRRLRRFYDLVYLILATDE